MKPVIALVCDTTTNGLHVFHQAGDKYVQALIRCADVMPILIPAMAQPLEVEAILNLADGVLLTGGYSNIQRHHYGQDSAPEGEHEDPARDHNTLPLARAAMKNNIPLLGICRGLQELNVAMGGSLHPRVHEVQGRMDHREKKDDPLEVQYGPAHRIDLLDGGQLHKIVKDKTFMVNSLHGQAIRDLAPGLQVEATAEDGTIEAISAVDAKTFAIAVQWHPEWKAWDNPQSAKLFEAFGQAARRHKKLKN